MPSPDGRQIAFSWQGDLWVAPSDGGLARRLTVHPGYDYAPLWSPDGTKIAFTSDRYGNDDVFVLYLESGAIQRLTYFSGRDRALGWLPDSSGVVFESRRDWEPYSVRWMAYVAPLNGGTPYRLWDVEGTPLALAPDGKRIAFVRRDGVWWRKGYRGSAQGDLWLGTLGSKQFTRLTQTDTPDTWPMWSADGRTLYFVSERDGTFNLYAMEIDSRRTRPLTRFQGDGVRFPQINARGTLITFEQGMDVWRLDLPNGTPRPIPFLAPTLDARTNPIVTRTFTGNVTEFEVAPEGKEVAFIVRGELFVTRFPEGGVTQNLSETVAAEAGLSWSKDGKRLYFAREVDGQFDLFCVFSSDPNEPRLRRTSQRQTERLTQTPESETSPQVSPDGKWLAFKRGSGNLVVMNLETREERTLVRSWNLGTFVWSPDSLWLAFSMEEENYNSDIYIVSLEGGEPVNVSRHPRNDYAPSWSADGRVLVFLSERDLDTPNVCHLYLRQADYEKTRADRDDEEDERYDAPQKNAQAEQKKEEPTVTIDFEDIHMRIRLVTRYPAGVQEAVVSPDGEQIAFRSAYQGQSDLYLIKWDGSDERRLTTGGLTPTAIRWSKDGKTLYFLSLGRIHRIATAGGSPQATRTEVRLTLNEPAERNYLYESAWRVLNETFYDPHFHGVDWQAVREKYRPYLPYAQTDRDFTTVVLMMLGELRSSHVSFSKAGTDTPSVSTGMLGVVFSNRRDGEGLLIERVVPNTPAARKDVNLQPGERIMAVNGTRLTHTTNLWRLLENTVGERVQLLVRQPDGIERTVFLRPIPLSAYDEARYQEWVRQNRRYVEERSGGRIGYVHIQAMGEQSLREFERDLYAVASGKQALLIDVRFNGGGRTADYLLGMLHVPQHAYTIGRDGKPGYPIDRLPLVPWTKPIAVLCNERSFSNAEIFAHAIKTLKRGPLVGLPTAGGVISTGQATLMDGSRVSTPGRGWYTLNKHINMEGNGAQPDHLVEDLPEDLMENRDRQLDRALDLLLKP